jgi:hypothetical protein
VISGYLIAESYKPACRWLNQADADVASCQRAARTKIIIKIILVARPRANRYLLTRSRQPRSVANRVAAGAFAADDLSRSRMINSLVSAGTARGCSAVVEIGAQAGSACAKIAT